MPLILPGLTPWIKAAKNGDERFARLLVHRFIADAFSGASSPPELIKYIAYNLLPVLEGKPSSFGIKPHRGRPKEDDAWEAWITVEALKVIVEDEGLTYLPKEWGSLGENGAVGAAARYLEKPAETVRTQYKRARARLKSPEQPTFPELMSPQYGASIKLTLAAESPDSSLRQWAKSTLKPKDQPSGKGSK